MHKDSKIGKSLNISGNLHEIKLQEIKGNYFLITIDRCKLHQYKEFINVIISQHGMRNESNDRNENKYAPSGKLMIIHVRWLAIWQYLPPAQQ